MLVGRGGRQRGVICWWEGEEGREGLYAGGKERKAERGHRMNLSFREEVTKDGSGLT